MTHIHPPNIRSNLRKLKWVELLQSVSVMMPVITLFYQENGLSLSEIFLLQSVFAIAVFLFEVPTGYFGDRIGTKNSIAIGSVIIGVAFVLYATGTSFLQFAVFEVVLAFGFAFISGSNSALLYDSLKELGEADSYKKAEGKINFIGEASGALGGIIGGLIAHYYGARASMYAEGILVSLAIPFARSLVSIHNSKHNSDTSLRQSIRNIVKYSLHHNKELKRIIAFTAVLSTATMCIVRAMQPYLLQIGFPIALLGFARFALRGIVSISSLFAHWRDKTLGLKHGLFGLLMLGVCGYLISGFNPYQDHLIIGMIIGVFGLSLFHIQRGLQKPISNHAINKLVESDIRATVLSVNSMMGRLVYAILGPIIGWLGDLYSLQTMLILSAGIFGILGLVCFYKLFLSQTQPSLQRT